jgi:class 3 adenylate cyclase
LDIAAWLKALDLGRYSAAFEANDIDLAVLRTLNGDDLRELGVTSLGHRKKLLEAIAALGAPTPASAGAREAERRQLTVMFCDLVGSTALSAKLDPEDMREVIRAYQNAVVCQINLFEGHVAKYMGDGVLAYFGWPLAHEDDAERSVRAGLALVDAVAKLKVASGDSLSARVSIATGLVVWAIWWVRVRPRSTRWWATRPIWRRGWRAWRSPARW